MFVVNDKTMANQSLETVWKANEKELLELLNSKVLTPNPKEVTFYAPSFTH